MESTITSDVSVRFWSVQNMNYGLRTSLNRFTCPLPLYANANSFTFAFCTLARAITVPQDRVNSAFFLSHSKFHLTFVIERALFYLTVLTTIGTLITLNGQNASLLKFLVDSCKASRFLCCLDYIVFQFHGATLSYCP